MLFDEGLEITLNQLVSHILINTTKLISLSLNRHTHKLKEVIFNCIFFKNIFQIEHVHDNTDKYIV